MEIIKANYTGNDHIAKAENEVQQRYAVREIQSLQEQVKEERKRIEGIIWEPEYLEARQYLWARLKGLQELEHRLIVAWGEVAGIFDDKADS